MSQTGLQDWLKWKARTEAFQSLVFGVGCIAVAALVLTLTCIVVLVVAWLMPQILVMFPLQLITGTPRSLPFWELLLLSAAGVGSLFWLNARQRRRHLARRSAARAGVPEEVRSAVTRPRLVSLLAYPGTGHQPLADYLLTGPRLWSISWDSLRRAGRLMRFDLGNCERILSLLVARPSRVSFRKLSERSGLANPLRAIIQLRDLDGVLFLTGSPAGMCLTGALRKELSGKVEPGHWEHKGLRSGSVDRPRPSTLPEWLEIKPTASPRRVASAYRRRLRESEPEKVASLGRELEAMAREQTEAIHDAYAEFQRQHDASGGAVAQQPEETTAEKPERVWERHGPRS